LRQCLRIWRRKREWFAFKVKSEVNADEGDSAKQGKKFM
jgi:hypothetical protein